MANCIIFPDYRSRRMVDYSYLDLEDILEEEEEEYVSRKPGEGPGKSSGDIFLAIILFAWNLDSICWE